MVLRQGIPKPCPCYVDYLLRICCKAITTPTTERNQQNPSPQRLSFHTRRREPPCLTGSRKCSTDVSETITKLICHAFTNASDWTKTKLSRSIRDQNHSSNETLYAYGRSNPAWLAVWDRHLSRASKPISFNFANSRKSLQRDRFSYG